MILDRLLPFVFRYLPSYDTLAGYSLFGMAFYQFFHSDFVGAFQTVVAALVAVGLLRRHNATQEAVNALLAPQSLHVDELRRFVRAALYQPTEQKVVKEIERRLDLIGQKGKQ